MAASNPRFNQKSISTHETPVGSHVRLLYITLCIMVFAFCLMEHTKNFIETRISIALNQASEAYFYNSANKKNATINSALTYALFTAYLNKAFFNFTLIWCHNHLFGSKQMQKQALLFPQEHFILRCRCSF